MRGNLLEFLFGQATARRSADLGEDIVRLFEEAEIADLEPVTAAEKKPLAAALKDIGISGTPKAAVHWMELQCPTDQEYHEYCRLLSEPDNITKLAERGWVAVKLGDSGQMNEPPQYRIGFIEVQTHVVSDKDKPDQSIKDILDQGQKFATTPVAVDTEDNPVERETGEPDTKQGGKTEGVGTAKDGDAPEGKPKGSEKKVSEAREAMERCPKCGSDQHEKGVAGFGRTGGKETSPKPMRTCKKCGHKWTVQKEDAPYQRESARARQIVDKLLNEMTSTSGMGTVTAGMAPGMADNPNQRRVRKRNPGAMATGAARAAFRRRGHENPR